MKDYRKEFPVGKMCQVFGVSRSGFYDWLHRLPSERDNENRMLVFQIRRIHEQSKASYGSPRMTDELKAQGFTPSRQRVARLMKQQGLRAVHAKKFVVTTDSNHNYPVVENKLKRNFTAQRPGQVWVSDITYVKTGQSWLYLTVIIDLYDRKVVGWSQSADMSAANTTVAAWKMAVNNRPFSQSLIFHSDRGIQYACQEFTQLLDSYPNVQRSMSRKANCWDNAVAESFFKSIKVERIYRNNYRTRHQAALDIFEWIETWYNRRRRHSALGGLNMIEFEQLNQINLAA